MYYYIPCLLASFFLLILFIFLISRKVNSKINISFGLVCFSGFFWLVNYGIGYLVSQFYYEKALHFFKLGYMGVIFIAITFFNYTVYFFNIENLRFMKALLGLIYFWGIFMIVLIWDGDLFISGLKNFFWGYYPVAGIYHPVFLSIFFLLVTSSNCILSYFMLFKKSEFSRLKYNQIKYILSAFLIFSFASVDFLPNYSIEIYPFGYLAVVLFCLIISYAIAKYRLMELNLIFTKAGIFIAVYSLVLGFPVSIAFIAQSNLKSYFGEIWWLFPLISSTVLATIGPFAYLYFDQKAEDKILKHQRNYHTVLKNASSGMIRVKDLNRLLSLIVRVVTKSVKIKHAGIFLFNLDNNEYILMASRGKKSNFLSRISCHAPIIGQLMKGREPIVTEEYILKLKDMPNDKSLSDILANLIQLNAALVVPSFVENRLIGFIVLGEKSSDAIFTQDDITIFLVLANQAALAIENAQFYNEIRKTQESLFKAEKMATIGTMADGLSHQINNRFHALSLIAGDSIDVIKTFDKDRCDELTRNVFKEIQTSLEKIQANVLQGGEVVKGLLKYSSPGQGTFERVDFEEVLTKTKEMVGYKIKLSEIDFISNITKNCFCFANSAQLQEVFFNLIDNAYDAIRERYDLLNGKNYRGRIEISTFSSNDFLNIKVKDNGMGVNQQNKKKLFTPFFTTKATAKKGTGLGLYVIEKIIAAHKGKITVDTVYQEGTVFTISLPIISCKEEVQ